jgi:hypothetical protein
MMMGDPQQAVFRLPNGRTFPLPVEWWIGSGMGGVAESYLRNHHPMET